jgi:cytoskeletal protein RodZ
MAGGMPPIGETLREARMRQGLDIADVEERTKIRAKYLRALENEEWGSLPGPTFVKTFLRTYAEVVGLDPHLLVDEYRAGHEPEEEMGPQPLGGPPAATSRPQRRRPTPPGPPGPIALVVLAGVVVVGLLLALGLSADEDEPQRQAADATDTTREEPAPRTRPRPAGVVLRVTPTDLTYACVDSGEGTEVMFEGTLEGARSFRNPRRLRINLGKRSVDMRANGRRVRIPESPNPIGYEITRSGAREIVEGTTPCG